MVIAVVIPRRLYDCVEPVRCCKRDIACCPPVWLGMDTALDGPRGLGQGLPLLSST